MAAAACLFLVQNLFGQDAAAYAKTATRLVALINAADYPGVENLFNKEMSQALPLDKSTVFFKGLTAQFGKIHRLETPKPIPGGMVFPAQCERGALDMTLTLDGQNNIAGLSFKPVAASSDAAPKEHQAELSLPFRGRWFVAAGGDTPNVNHHMNVRAQWYAIDFMKVGGPSQRELAKTDGLANENSYSWGESVLSPCAGEVVGVVNGLPDNPLGKKDAKNPAGNHVVIKIAPDRYVFVAHLQRNSVKVKAGDRLVSGQEIGKCGNSGNSDAPHVHLHIQDQPILNQGEGQNIFFKGINVELTGKIFEKVDWPLIQGLFVWP